MVAILVAHPHMGMLTLLHPECQYSAAPLGEVHLMPEEEQEPKTRLEEFDRGARLNFRDYPSSSLVMIAALSSGVGWMLYASDGTRLRS